MRRLHATVAKTIVFVTHDIDEAITMGDRIAILREGGVLAQYDTPDAILAHPADEFVAQFIGEDRALRRLALRRVGEIELDPVPATRTPMRAGVGRRRPSATRSRCCSRRRPTACSSPATTGTAASASSTLADAAGRCCSRSHAGGPVIPNFGQGELVRHRRPRLLLGLGEGPLGRHARSRRSSHHIELTLIAVVIGFALAFGLALLAHRFRRVEQPIAHRLGARLHDPEPRALPAARPVHRARRSTIEIALVGYTLVILFPNIVAGSKRAHRTCSRRRAGWG